MKNKNIIDFKVLSEVIESESKLSNVRFMHRTGDRLTDKQFVIIGETEEGVSEIVIKFNDLSELEKIENSLMHIEYRNMLYINNNLYL